jgi:opacity protein-like surface antigen
MGMKRVQKAVFILGLAAFSGVPVFAQTDVAFSVLAAFSQSTSGNGTVQSPSVHAGGFIQLRHISNPLVGYEATYSYNRANQVYAQAPSDSAVVVQPQPVSANASEITGDWVVSLRLLNFKPFALAGVGAIITRPVGDQSFTDTSTTVVYVYGAGLDVGLIPHFGLRLQYRGNVNKAPDISTVFTSTDKFIHTAEPMAGLYLRF